MLEFGPTYELTSPLIVSKLNTAGIDLEDQSDPPLPIGTKFIVFDWNEWYPYSEQLKKIKANPHFYAIELEQEILGSKKYLALAHRLEADSRQSPK